MSATTVANTIKKVKLSPKNMVPLEGLFDNNPLTAIQSGKVMAKAWTKSLLEADHQAQAQTFVFKAIESYWLKTMENSGSRRPLPFLFKRFTPKKLDNSVLAVADAIGVAAAKLPVIEASYQLGNVYTAVLPEATRSKGGVFYTPPALTGRLLSIAEDAGVNWATAKVLDPACGGGAFLAPVCLKMVSALKGKSPKQILNHIQSHVIGWEIDPFGGWLTQVFAEVALKDIIEQAGIGLQPLVHICDSLNREIVPELDRFDLVIGNPPYGKVKLTEAIRAKYKDSLYGHPNYYGLFTHLALNLVRNTGIVAFLTPTSFLSGEYFKSLRLLLRKESSLLEIDFVSVRKGVFEDVLQETMLATYKKERGGEDRVKVNQISTTPEGGLHINKAGLFKLSDNQSAPWILPRVPEQAKAVRSMNNMSSRLANWGYKVSTGPLVWNRHKDQLCNKDGKGIYPVIWAEAITQDGKFLWRADKQNHKPYFKFRKGDDWLVIKKPCILLQRTTAKEQEKRLIAAALPEAWLVEEGGVVIENHLNMIIPIVENPPVSPAVLAVFLNSRAANDAFRSISGSVAVSAYELEALPLPSPAELLELSRLVADNEDQPVIETACHQLYSLDHE